MSTWTCRKCKARNTRTASPKCGTCGERTKPAKRGPRHAKVLRETSRAELERLSSEIHGTDPGVCACCGRPKGEREFDRDHDHSTGHFRGLIDWRCNRELLRGHTIESLRSCLAYMERAQAFYAEREVE